jgi:hypothetical protein
VAVLAVILEHILDVRSSQKPFLLRIKHLESISEVEVSHLSKSYLGLFHFSLVSNHILENCDELILLIKV